MIRFLKGLWNGASFEKDNTISTTRIEDSSSCKDFFNENSEFNITSEDKIKSGKIDIHVSHKPTNEGQSYPLQIDKNCESAVKSSFVSPVIIPLQERHKLEFWTIVIGGVALAFNSGLLNGTTLQLHGLSVTHVTGSTSSVAVSYVIGGTKDDILYSLLIISFILGAIITGIVSPSSSFKLGAQYGPLFIIGSIFLVISSLLEVYYPNSNGDLYFASMASGLQNAITTKYSSSVIRTTHVTGTATDIGIIIGRLLRGDTSEQWKLNVLIPIYMGFLLGGICSVPAVRTFQKKALVVNIIVFFVIGVIYTFIIMTKLQVPLWRVMLGMYTFAEKKAKKASQGMRKISSKVLESIERPLRQSGSIDLFTCSQNLRQSRDDVYDPNDITPTNRSYIYTSFDGKASRFDGKSSRFSSSNSMDYLIHHPNLRHSRSNMSEINDITPQPLYGQFEGKSSRLSSMSELDTIDMTPHHSNADMTFIPAISSTISYDQLNELSSATLPVQSSSLIIENMVVGTHDNDDDDDKEVEESKEKEFGSNNNNSNNKTIDMNNNRLTASGRPRYYIPPFNNNNNINITNTTTTTTTSDIIVGNTGNPPRPSYIQYKYNTSNYTSSSPSLQSLSLLQSSSPTSANASNTTTTSSNNKKEESKSNNMTTTTTTTTTASNNARDYSNHTSNNLTSNTLDPITALNISDDENDVEVGKSKV